MLRTTASIARRCAADLTTVQHGIQTPVLPRTLTCMRTGYACVATQPDHHLTFNQLHQRHQSLHTSATRRNIQQDPKAAIPEDAILATYSAPLAKTFFRLKFFSLSSLGAAIVLTPALLYAPAEVGWAGRLGLCATALATSSASTAIFAWIGKPYVGAMRLLDSVAARITLQRDINDPKPLGNAQGFAESDVDVQAKAALQCLTTDWRLRALRTTIYEPGLIRPTGRPLATWEVTNAPPALNEKEASYADEQSYPVTKLAASTRLEKTGELIGRFWVTWPQKGAKGRCAQEGRIIRHYTVHEEQLGDEWRVL